MAIVARLGWAENSTWLLIDRDRQGARCACVAFAWAALARAARGHRLRRDPRPHCAYCHSTPDQWDALDRGEPLPLSGGYRFDAPPGIIHTPNITPDAETGIGQRTDG